MSFSSLSKRAQVNHLRGIARQMLAEYPFEIARISLVTHLFNTTFKVIDTDGRKFAIRINTNSKREAEETNAEVAWVDALARETDLWLPVPQKTKNGELTAEADSDLMGRRLRGIVYSWLPGPNVGPNLTPRIAFAMGEATAKMHRHAETFQMPKGCRLHPLKDPLFGYPSVLRKYAPSVDHDLYDQVMEISVPIIERLKAGPQIPIHYDVHFWNVKWTKGRLSVFDFDDTIMGVPVFDAYVTLFYLRNRDNWPELQAAYLEGIGRPVTEMDVTKEEFETLVASRGLLLANELFRWGNPEMTKIAPRYAEITEARFRHFFDTGVFDPLVAKL